MHYLNGKKIKMQTGRYFNQGRGGPHHHFNLEKAQSKDRENRPRSKRIEPNTDYWKLCVVPLWHGRRTTRPRLNVRVLFLGSQQALI